MAQLTVREVKGPIYIKNYISRDFCGRHGESKFNTPEKESNLI